MKFLLITLTLLITIDLKAQTCNCEKEFLNIKNIVETGFSGFPDKVKSMTEAGYNKKVAQLQILTRDKFASDNCILIISKYLKLFKSYHLSYWSSFDRTKIDTAFVNQRPLFEVTDKDIARLKKSRSWEGIYYFMHDSSIKIAVIKDPTPLHDYVGVTLESKLPTWKRGMIKIEGKLINDSVMKGLYYMRNHRPEEQGFMLWQDNNMLGGDFRREGTPGSVKKESVPAKEPRKPLPTIDARSLSPNTFYIKMASCDIQYKPAIDSILKANEGLLHAIPNLIIDLRDNGGGFDDCWEPFIPYMYTDTIKNIGADVLASETTIAVMKKMLEDKRVLKEVADFCSTRIPIYEKAKGQWIVHNNDEVISNLTPTAFPKKIVMIVDRWCGSATEEFLLLARQSKKVTIVGENTVGNLDYSNTLTTPFLCYPYTLVYPITRSRRLNIGQGIDNVGIAPNIRLAEDKDWLAEALKIAEQ